MSYINQEGERRKPEFIEDDFISAIETAINRHFFYNGKSVEISRISQKDENELGYDGIFTTLVPFYIQFKRSFFYNPNFKGKLMKDRKKLGLPVDKGFFSMELLRKNNSFEQHNALYKLSKNSKAVYVAPKFYKKNDLSKLKEHNNDRLPVYYDEVNVHSMFGFPYSRRYIYGRTLLFENSITVPPHDFITDNEPSHYYTFDRSNKNVGFHSDPIIPENFKIQDLYQFLGDIFENEQKDQQISNTNFQLLPSLFNLEKNSNEFLDIINLAIDRNSIYEQRLENINMIDEVFSEYDKLLILEDLLYNYFGIRQLIKIKE